ncbi:unnamed protein product [Triticum aestivum]|uniref:RNase H type-1 domain-containing protein n=1 Tax=Triticum aestivum TaxID=4565 RepID=A0A7H4LGZ0_WHEAT|nr:unnamed protein product [Triticum aestivum]
MMKKTDDFVWSDAANAAFEDLKRHLSDLPVLAAPIDKEPLLLYVAANTRVFSVVIVVERKEAGKEHPVQQPVYYISEVLIESKQRYPHWQKLVYGVFMASRKLKQYFQAEYEALLHGLRMAKEMNLSRVRCFGDSNLVAQQVSGKWDSKDPLMAAYRREVDAIAGHFKGYQVEHIDRRKNEAVDALSRLGSQRKPVPPNTFLDVLHNPSVKLPTEEDLAIPDPEAQLVAALHVIPDWTVPYLAYMTRGELPEDETLARQITRRSKSMTIANGELHHRSVTGAFQRYVSPEEGQEILREIHEGDCGHHAGSKSLVSKAFRRGFYWLTRKIWSVNVTVVRNSHDGLTYQLKN